MTTPGGEQRAFKDLIEVAQWATSNALALSAAPSAGSLTSSFEIMSIFLANLIANRCDKCLLHDQSPLCVVMTGV
jgi:hypothetical protein